MTLIPKTHPARSRAFLRWAKEQCGPCCLCAQGSSEVHLGAELHHFGEKGMGQKASDFLVCRLCEKHHKKVQGKRWVAFLRSGEVESLAVMQRDCLELLSGYAAELEHTASLRYDKAIQQIIDDPHCAMDEAVAHVLETMGLMGGEEVEEELDFWKAWAVRRTSLLLDHLLDALLDIDDTLALDQVSPLSRINVAREISSNVLERIRR